MPRVRRTEDDRRVEKAGGNSMSRAEKRFERAQEETEGKGRRKEQADRRAALGPSLFEQGPNRRAECHRRSGHSGGKLSFYPGSYHFSFKIHDTNGQEEPFQLKKTLIAVNIL